MHSRGPRQSGLVHAGLVLATFALSSCAREEPSPLPGLIPTSSGQFSAQDKRIAQSLSLGNVHTVSEDASPYIAALTCTIALNSISERLLQAGASQSTHIVVIGQAQGIYARRAAQLGAQLDKSQQDIANDRKDRAEALPELRDRGLLAIQCLRRLT